MEIHYLELLVLFAAFILSAFFSGAETTFFSLRKADLHRFSHSQSAIERSIHRVMTEPEKILVTVLVGNLFVNIIIASISTRLLLLRWPAYGHLVSTAIVTPVVILFCEISPKVIAMSAYESLSRKIFPVMNFFHVVLYPIRRIMLLVTDLIIRIFNLKMAHSSITEDELDHAVHRGAEEGIIGKEEGAFIQNIMLFARKEASNIMFPRNRAVFIPFGASVKEAMELIIKYNAIRVPVYKDDLDHVVGFINSKELLPYHMGYKKAKNINKFIQDIEFFPSTRELMDLLNDFIAKRLQIAVLVDEYGGTAGVVTLNRILSELMGKEFTKWEIDGKRPARKSSGNIVIINGNMQIADFNYTYHDSIMTTESDTVGGYITERLSHFPGRGEEIRTDSYILRVKKVRKNIIESVEVTGIHGKKESVHE